MEGPLASIHSEEFKEALSRLPGHRIAELMLRVQLRYFLNYWKPEDTVLRADDPEGRSWAWLDFARGLLAYDYALRTDLYDFDHLRELTGRRPNENDVPDFFGGNYSVEVYLPHAARQLTGEDADHVTNAIGTLESISHEVSGRDYFREIFADVEKLAGNAKDIPLFDKTDDLGERRLGALRNIENRSRLPSPFHFWGDWYAGVLSGDRIDAELQHRVDQIDGASWDLGIEHIGARIEDIRRTLQQSTTQIETTARTQAQQLIADPMTAALAAKGLEELIQSAVSAYKLEVSNALPEELEPLEELSKVMNQIAVVLAGTSALSDREQKLVALLLQTAHALEVVNGRLNTANSKIRAHDGLEIARQEFYRGAGSLIWSRTLWGSLGAVSMLLLGPGSSELLSSLSSCVSERIQSAVEVQGESVVTRHTLED